MPWTGWNESLVRPQRHAAPPTSHSPAPATMGSFTAINSSGPAAPAHPNHTGDTSAAPGTASLAQNVTIASRYLERGDQEPSAAASKPAPKCAAAMTKKRAGTAPSTKNAKRRKTSNVSDAMPVAKPRTASKKQSTARSKAKNQDRTDQSALQHEQPATPARVKDKSLQHAKQSTAEEADSTSSSTLVSVIAPSTSMGAFHNDSQQTSFDAVKSSSGRGTMLYSSASSPAKQESSMQTPKPLLSRTQNSSAKTNKGSCDCDMAEDAYPFDEHEFEINDDDFGTIFDELARQIEGKTAEDGAPRGADTRRTTRSATKKVHQQPTSKAVQATGDEYSVVDDDDELAEGMAPAEKATESSKSKKKPRTAKQLPTPENSDTMEFVAETAVAQPTQTASDEFGDAMMIPSDDEDEDVIELEKAIRAAEKAGLKPRAPKQNVRVVDTHENYGGTLLDEVEKQLLDELEFATQTSSTKPIVRSSFPQPILDRSPLFGATNTVLLRTCFRLGEAINVGSHAARTNQNLILEIYARVAASSRDGRKQHFIFRDLYHDKPPHLEGEGELWGQSRLWELDGRGFLRAAERDEGVMCRALARMRREGTKWRLEVLSIWEAGWEDVEAVAGIYGKGGDAKED